MAALTNFDVFFLVILTLSVLQEVNAQENCNVNTPTQEGEFLFLQPFVPSFYDTWRFKIRAASDAYLKLSSNAYDIVEREGIGEVYRLELGVKSGGQQISRLRRLIGSSASTPEINTLAEFVHLSPILSLATDSNFYIKISSSGQLQVGIDDDFASPFLSVNAGPDIFQNIRYVGINSIVGSNNAVWDLCDTNEQSLTLLSHNKDASSSSVADVPASRAVDGNTANGNLNHCTRTSEEINPWWRVDLGMVYDVGLVEVINPSAANLDTATEANKLEGAVISVGSCEDLQNPQCDQPVLKKEAINGLPILRKCPTNSLGQFVYIVVPGSMKQVALCEVKVYGRKVSQAQTTTLSLTASQLTRPEGESESFDILREGVTQSCSKVEINVIDGNATEGEDFTLSTNQAPFGRGEDVFHVLVSLIDNIHHEKKEQVILQLQNPVGAVLTSDTISITITDDDELFGFEQVKYTVYENIGFAEIMIIREGELLKGVTAVVTLTGDTAEAGVDFDSQLKTVSFLMGQDSAVIRIPIIDDMEEEGTERFRLTLAITPGDGSIDPDRREAYVILFDDESPPTTVLPTITYHCPASFCKNGGTCIPGDNENTCVCPEDFQGERCTEPIKKGGLSFVTIIIIVGVGLAVVVMVILVVCCLRKRRSVSRPKSRTASRGPIVNNDYLNPMDLDNPSIELRGHGSPGNNETEEENPPRHSTLMMEKSHHEIPRKQIKLHEIIGSGAYGNVHRATAIGIVPEKTLADVAVKIMKDTELPTSEFVKELKFLQSLEPHPNIIGFVGCCTKTDPYYLVLEYAPKGNLREYLHSIRKGRGEKVLKPRELIGFALDVSKGMEFISSKNCIHRDLATRNILLGEGMVCKLSDFGFARDMETRHQYEMKSGGRVPVRWMAPESIEDNIYTIKTDVWSFGIVLWELVTMGAHPYSVLSAGEVINMVCDGKRLEKPEHCSDEMYKFMLKCWDENSKRRPDFQDIRKQLEIMMADATGYLKMKNLKRGSYVYLQREKWEENFKESVVDHKKRPSKH